MTIMLSDVCLQAFQRHTTFYSQNCNTRALAIVSCSTSFECSTIGGPRGRCYTVPATCVLQGHKGSRSSRRIRHMQRSKKHQKIKSKAVFWPAHPRACFHFGPCNASLARGLLRPSPRLKIVLRPCCFSKRMPQEGLIVDAGEKMQLAQACDPV